MKDKICIIEEDEKVYHNLATHRLDLRLPFRLLKIIRKEKIDVLFLVNQPLIQFWGVLCGWMAGVPVRIAAIRSTGKVNRIQRRLWINRLTFPWMTRVTALSEMHKDYLVNQEKIDKKKIEVITNGVELPRLSGQKGNNTLKKELGIPPNAPVVGIVAMLRPEKGHHVFIKAASRVLQSVSSAHFVIVGSGPERGNLEGLVTQLGVRDSIHILGSREDVPELLNIFNVAVLSSHAVVETVSNAVLEYMAVGKAVVSTSVGSLPEMIEDGVSGYLVEPGDWKTMADRIVTVLKNEKLAKRLGQAAKKRVAERYTIEHMISGWEDLFERLVKEAQTS